MEDQAPKAIWNLDNVELYIIFQIKMKFITALEQWNLEDAYWSLRDLRRELDAKIGRSKEKFDGITLEEDKEAKEEKKKTSTTEKIEVDKKIKDLEIVRLNYSKLKIQTLEERGKYYLALEELYMYLCFLMKKHGLYFREGEDSRMAVLRR